MSTSAATAATASTTRRTRCRRFEAAKACGRDDCRDRRRADRGRRADRPARPDRRPHDGRSRLRGRPQPRANPQARCRSPASIRASPERRFRPLAEALDWAKREDMGIVLEIKEAERPDLAVDRVAALLEATGTVDRVIVISFDHVVLKRAARAPSGPPDRGHHACPPRRHRRRAAGVRRELRLDRARHVPSRRRPSAARGRLLQSRAHSATRASSPNTGAADATPCRISCDGSPTA